MALAHRLDLRTSQSLVMTPQLQQAIKLLQLSNLELAAVVDQELERNPLLERASGERGDAGAPDTAEAFEGDRSEADPLGGDPGEKASPDAPTESLADAPWDYDPSDDENAPGETLADTDVGDGTGLWTQDGIAAEWGMHVARTPAGMMEGVRDDATAALRERTSLREEILRQAELELPTLHERMIAAHLVEWLDEAGYLRGGVEETAEHLGVPVRQVEDVLARLQQFEPAGIFARDLAECLALQLAERGALDAVMESLLDRLDLLARRDFKRLAKLCAVDLETLIARVTLLRSLDPKPAARFDELVAQPITPDILMRGDASSGWEIELNPDTLPRVLVNRRYYARIKAATRPRSPDREFIAEQLANATWLVKALEQRATTILTVAREIVRHQADFFVHGIAALRPLVLREIAEAIGMHESTVSRVTANKYIATPRGVFELKHFFSGAVGAEGASHASASVRHRIKTMIEAESPTDVLSDDQIVIALKREGIDIARRTVAKYRESLHIPSSVQRRRDKALARGAA